MNCSRQGCTGKADKRCAECNRPFCSKHYEICDFCEEPVCHDCREAHQSSPLHDEERPSA
jgi:hypothetical protein